jgi:hypothetical protein
MSGVQRELDVGGGGTRNVAEPLARDRARVLEVFAFGRRYPFPADEIFVAVADQNLLRGFL